MTSEFKRQFDRDDELRALLATGDPVRALAPADPAGLARMLEDTMIDTDTRGAELPTGTGTEDRRPRTWLLAAAAVFVVAGLGLFAATQLGDDAPPPTAQPSSQPSSQPNETQPVVTELAAPPAATGKCVLPNAELLAGHQLAFAGTVTAVEGDTVTLETTTAYAGEVGEVVEVTAPPAELQALLLATDFEVGGEYLVSATDGQVSVCGFSGAATPQLEQLYQEAFPGVRLHGLLLAAGAGTRMGGPKALVHEDGRSWLRAGVELLTDGGCESVTVVLGAQAQQAHELVGDLDVSVVVAEDWTKGMSASLRAGLVGLDGSDADAALVSLVDLPDLTAEVVRRVAAAGAESGTGSGALVRATYQGEPGHPVLLGRDHWPGVVVTATGDQGARDYLAAHGATPVECGDLATGRDVDTRHEA